LGQRPPRVLVFLYVLYLLYFLYVIPPMLIREYQQHDLDALRAIHAAQGFDYALPDLSNPLFVTKLVLVDAGGSSRCRGTARLPSAGQTCCAPTRQDSSAGRDSSASKILGAALLRLTAEAYLLLDPCAGTTRERWHALLALHAATERDAWQRGLEDVHAWLPPPIAHKFGRRLQRLGWLRDDTWTPYCKRLEEK